MWIIWGNLNNHRSPTTLALRPLIPVFALLGSASSHALQFKAIYWYPDNISVIGVLPLLEKAAVITDFSEVAMTGFGLQFQHCNNADKRTMDGSWDIKGLMSPFRFYGETSLFYYHLGDNYTYDPVASSRLYIARWPKLQVTMSQQEQLWRLPEAGLGR